VRNLVIVVLFIISLVVLFRAHVTTQLIQERMDAVDLKINATENLVHALNVSSQVSFERCEAMSTACLRRLDK
jgi:hypothetical protein